MLGIDDYLTGYIVNKRDIEDLCKDVEKGRNLISKNRLSNLNSEVIHLEVDLDAKIIIKCKRCFQKLRVPVSNSRLEIVCPICKEGMKLN